MALPLLLLLVILPVSAVQFKGRGACFVLFEGCNIRVGRCVCGRTSDKCYNTYSYTDEPECRQDLFKQPNPADHQLRTVRRDYPYCTPAQFLPLCSPRHVGTKYCHGSCDKACCVIPPAGCLPPTNVYVPATSCAKAERNFCELHRRTSDNNTVFARTSFKNIPIKQFHKDHVCRKGYKCESVKEECSVLPCNKEPRCVVDDDYSPCQMVKCGEDHGRKICIRQRTHCREKKCPFTYRCVLLATFIRPLHQRNGCANCPRISTQESFCRNQFAVRIRVHSLLWKERWYETLGLCDWYSATVEYVLKKNVQVTVLSNATIVVKSKQLDSCSCLPDIAVEQRYLVIGERMKSAGYHQVIHIPQYGYIKSWQLAKRRSPYTSFEECKDGD